MCTSKHVAGFADGHGGDGYLNLHDGPYTIQEPRRFYQPGYYPYGFNPEVGSVGVPVEETMRVILAAPGLAAEPAAASAPAAAGPGPSFPQFCWLESSGMLDEQWDAVWEYHRHMPYGDPAKGVVNQLCVYGVPRSLADYCSQAQLANYCQHRALVEGYTSKMWAEHTGFLIWKTQSPWLGLRGQLYDWLLDPTASLFGVKHATAPLHPQLCPMSGGGRLQGVNMHARGVRARFRVLAVGLDGQTLFDHKVKQVFLPAASVTDLGSLPSLPPASPPDQVYFLRLELCPLCRAESGQGSDRGHAENRSGSDRDQTGPPTPGLRRERQCEPAGPSRHSTHCSTHCNAYCNTYWLRAGTDDSDVSQSQDELWSLAPWRRSSLARSLLSPYHHHLFSLTHSLSLSLTHSLSLSLSLSRSLARSLSLPPSLSPSLARSLDLAHARVCCVCVYVCVLACVYCCAPLSLSLSLSISISLSLSLSLSPSLSLSLARSISHMLASRSRTCTRLTQHERAA